MELFRRLISARSPLALFQGIQGTARRWESTVSNPNATPSVGTKTDAELAVTENCGKKLSEILASSHQFLRLSVEGGGCSGFQYKFEVDTNIQPDDKRFQHPKYSSASVVVDPSSLEYLQGSTVDYQTELIRSAFRVLKNPNADHGCSCGASFTIKLD